MSNSMRPPPPVQPNRAKGASRAEARGKVDGERDHEDHAEEAVLYKGFTFAHAKAHATRQSAGQGRPPAKNLPKGTPPRKKKNAARTQAGDQQEQSSEIEIQLGEDEDAKRVAAAERLTFKSKDEDQSNAESNTNEGARTERRFRQIRMSHINLDKPVMRAEQLDPDKFGDLMFTAASQIQGCAAMVSKGRGVTRPIQALSQEMLSQFRTLLERGSAVSREKFSSLAGVREVLIKLPRPAMTGDRDLQETINLILPVLLLNVGNPRTDKRLRLASDRLASVRRGLKNTGGSL
jgi:hypothetical protein